MLTGHESTLFRIAWILLVITGAGILIFGLITAILPGSSDTSAMRAIGVASIGMGLFGVLITIIPFRRRERWAWFTLWYYPVFWLAHYIGQLPPGQDQIHQIVFVVISLVGLLLTANEFLA